eukprot:CAMPEP_0197182124 /NCGR_PEP_ID=MMETSP1423-20130617/6190_1 /TAXON_ID=476441 /ORGANISM="Pseudo-nitzschia heimii, Strain UNC1101" /LENGTH=99 /DNA_ID=CAMNT_0042632499 /DNA_START=231 /DNA_END=530 /DNA_ORIENTATION=+
MLFSRSTNGILRSSQAGKRVWRTAQQQQPTNRFQQQKRTMGGGGSWMTVNPLGERLGEAFGTVCWLWVFWRFKQDGRVLLGYEHPWDHGGGHGHGDDHH